MNSSEEKVIRIAYIIGKMWAGGVETVVFNYYRAIDHAKYQFDFFYDEDSTICPPEDLIELGARFFVLPPYQKLPKYIKTLRKYLKNGEYRIVHSHLNTISVFPLYAAWKEHIPVRIAHNHSVPGGNEIKRNILKYILRCFSKIFATDYFACSEKAGRWMFGDKEFEKGSVFVVKNAIDFSKFVILSAELEYIKQEYNIENEFVVGHVGRYTFAKNHIFLLKVFEEIHNRIPNSRLLLVGDGELHDEINKCIKQLNIEKYVIQTGKVSDPEKYYSLMDVLIIPSVFEGLSMTTIEAQASGKPAVISTSIPEEAVISDGCFYEDINSSVSEWADIAIKVANKKINYNEKKDDYDIHSASKKLEEKYKELLERK